MHQRRNKCAEAKAFDDDGAEVRDAAVGDVADGAEDKEEIQLDVEEGFFDLVALHTLFI